MSHNHHTTISQQVDLQEALRIAQSRHIAIVPTARSVALWAPGVRVPGQVRLAIMANRREVLRMMNIGEIAVCPSPHLHRSAWSYFAGHYICDLCSRMDRAMRLACVGSEKQKSA
jgi:hypothetical protein